MRASQRRTAVLGAAALALAGCSARGPARSATQGVLDAIEQPDAGHPLVRDLDAVLKSYLEQARKRGPERAPADAAHDLAGAFVGGATDAVAAKGPAMQAMIETVTRTALRAALDELEGRPPRRASAGGGAEPPPARPPRAGERPPTSTEAMAGGAMPSAEPDPPSPVASAERAGAAMVHGATAAFLAELEKSLGRDGDGRLAEAMSATAARTTTSMLRAAGSEAGAVVSRCAPDDAACAADAIVRRLARAAAAGATDAVRVRVDPWPSVFAAIGGAIGGLLLGAAGAWAMARRGTRARV
jgi:hypothetical protein